MYEPTPAIRALMDSSPTSLRTADAEGLEHFVYVRILQHSELRPYSWKEFLAERPDRSRALALVYDRPSGLVFLGGHAHHDRLSAMLFQLRQLDASAAGRLDDVYVDLPSRYDRQADAFITEGVGLRMGSPSAQMGRRTLMVGRGVKLTPAEAEAFADYKLERI